MIQRIQTVYLTFVFFIAAVLTFAFPLYSETYTGTETPKLIYFTDFWQSAALFGLSALLALISIFGYKKRQNQFVLNRLNIVFNFILLGFFVYQSLNLSGEVSSEKGIGFLLPAISIVLLVLANKAIKKDEELVKSADRLR